MRIILRDLYCGSKNVPVRMLYLVYLGQFIGSRLFTELDINGIGNLDSYFLQTDPSNLENGS